MLAQRGIARIVQQHRHHGAVGAEGGHDQLRGALGVTQRCAGGCMQGGAAGRRGTAVQARIDQRQGLRAALAARASTYDSTDSA
ncbi:hypothetical protein QTH90_10625 [Variovorax sp. J2P1-59]|uniref:hypothetical protein n=1 Tax=Variovorax flavidus TaxID=3053501 RepID=UPI0025779E63|nr:hypothetical protein [Variovorax sp. J2P1-59]MDM0074836.1 hypothetical protein [Variovorax sp. J2P1-59]